MDAQQEGEKGVTQILWEKSDGNGNVLTSIKKEKQNTRGMGAGAKEGGA